MLFGKEVEGVEGTEPAWGGVGRRADPEPDRAAGCGPALALDRGKEVEAAVDSEGDYWVIEENTFLTTVKAAKRGCQRRAVSAPPRGAVKHESSEAERIGRWRTLQGRRPWESPTGPVANPPNSTTWRS